METKQIKLQINLPVEGVMITGQEYFDFLLFKANITKGKDGTDIGSVIKAKLGSMRFDTLDSIKQQLPVIVELLKMIEEVVIEVEDQPLMKAHVPADDLSKGEVRKLQNHLEDDTHGGPRKVVGPEIPYGDEVIESPKTSVG